MFTDENFNFSNKNYNSNEIAEIKKKIVKNDKSIKEFEGHLRSLLSITNESELEYSYQVQKGLEKLKYLIEDNITSKRLLMKEYKRGEELENEIKSLKQNFEKNKNILNKSEKGKLLLEKQNLLSNIDTLSNEIDKYSEENNNLINIIKMNENTFNKLNQDIEKLKQENEILLNILNYVELNKVFAYENKNNNIFSCMGNNQENKYSMNFK
jgi:DNA repair exonuclease SbcCD ATPase subunit